MHGSQTKINNVSHVHGFYCFDLIFQGLCTQTK